MRSSPPAAARACALLALTVCLGCARGTESSPRPLVVYAAASLQTALRAFADEFEAAHPGARVQLSFAGTQELATWLEHGAEPDVFAGADQAHLAALHERRLVEAPIAFVCNTLVVVVPRANPAGLAGFADLPRAKRLVLATPEVPAGAYTEQVLERAAARFGPAFAAALRARTASRELNVRQVLAKVTLGEADAAIVYRSDALAAGAQVLSFDIPEELNVTARYDVALRRGTTHPLASAFVGALSGEVGARHLGAAGFLPCPEEAR